MPTDPVPQPTQDVLRMLEVLPRHHPFAARPRRGAPAAEPLAIVGMTCRLPGGDDDPEAFWRLPTEGVDAITEFPAERASTRGRSTTPAPTARQGVHAWGGFLDDVDRFDPRSSGSRRARRRMDPQQRLLLEVAWEALEDAGMPPDGSPGSRTGVFVGICTSDYDGADASARTPTGSTPTRRRGSGAQHRGGPHLVRARAPGPEPGRRHGLLVVAGRRPPGACRACGAASASSRSPAA